MQTSVPQPSWRDLYPFQSHWLDLDGHRYHYLEEGPEQPEKGQTFLFVHGNPTWSFHFREAIKHFRKRYRVVAPDHLGCGLSDKPADWPYLLEGHIRNLVRLVEERDLRRLVLVGHDWGGAIGLGAAERCADRFERIVLMNTGAFRPWYIPWRIRICRWPVFGRLAVQGCNAFSRAALLMAMEHRKQLAKEERAGYLAPYDSWSHRRGVYNFVRDIPMSSRHPSWNTLAEVERRLPELRTKPVQLIWGIRDWCFRPDCLEKFIEIFPDAEVHRIADAGHWVIEDAQDEAIRRIDSFVEADDAEASV